MSIQISGRKIVKLFLKQLERLSSPARSVLERRVFERALPFQSKKNQIIACDKNYTTTTTTTTTTAAAAAAAAAANTNITTTMFTTIMKKPMLET